MGRRSNYTAKQKAEVVLSVLSKETTVAEGCRRNGITETTGPRGLSPSPSPPARASAEAMVPTDARRNGSARLRSSSASWASRR